jgi:uncharacterized protein (DUF1330 family)
MTEETAPPQPKGYLMVELEVFDAEGFERYRSQVAPMIARFGGQYIVRGGEVVEFEGEAPKGRVIVVEFPNLAMAKAFLHSEEYQPLIAIRQGSSNSRIFMVEGAPL